MSLNVVVTGANRGIGLEFCRHYANSARVFAVCRTSTVELDELPVQVIAGVDVAQAGDVAELHDRLQNTSIDILINNAGVFLDETVDAMNFDTIALQFAVNAVGPLRVTHALLPQLHQGSKVAMITSRMGSIADNGSGGYYGYRMSKAALNAASVSLARDLKSKGVAVGIYHPGFVRTRMVDFAGDITPDVAATRIAGLIEKLTLKNSGSFWHSNGEVLPW